MDNGERLRNLRAKLCFHGYASKNLDWVAAMFFERFQKAPKAFMSRSPFGITGKMDYLRMLVISDRCGANAIYVPYHLDKQELEDILMQIGDVHRAAVYDRTVAIREAAKLIRQQEAIAVSGYEHHCTYCGRRMVSDFDSIRKYCDSDECIEKHKEFLRRQQDERAKREPKPKKESEEKIMTMPDFNLDDPKHDSLQGYVYLIRAENGLCKIGRSCDPSGRYGEVATYSPIPVYLEHTVFSDNYVLAEAYAHEELARYRHHGEWFDLPDDIYGWFLGLENFGLDAF